ncbi:phosphodiester glycosidase family protein [Actinobaculum sp. 352]|uniref:phosphodiester glycosidase family protein n=1 Tax=Actinobaculum sp. 352 TaxID=2490946 RepID=UPI000F7E2FDE|nr:phosphodiester glycosidase family protein [Actinobaculum sp. 352]RTE48560.1 phosphodiester glycosidase family protein [Actinobaculum sp. 352]
MEHCEASRQADGRNGPAIAPNTSPTRSEAEFRAAQHTPAPHPRSLKRRRVVVGAGILTLALVGGSTAWALDRYVIDHVEIADVSALEAGASASWSSTSSSGSTDSEQSTDTADHTATVTYSSYTASNASISVETVTTGGGDNTVTYYVATVSASDGTAIRSAFAKNSYGTNITDKTSTIAEENNAILAINGDYYGFRDSGILIRNGVIYRDDGARTGLAIYRNGTMAIYDETTTSAQQLVDAGVWNTLSFGPALIENGEAVSGIDSVEIDTNFGNHSIQGEQPRTLIGQKQDGTFVFVVIDGRDEGYSRGATMTEAAQIMQSLGCVIAYNLDGGGSSTMYFNGEVINQPSNGGERGTSNILYIEDLS